jgi:AcrR family transcriptional regulator
MGSAERQRARTRRYRSDLRAAQAGRTRARILTAATERFLAVGYAAATIRSVASEADVSVPTVELLFGTKAQLLKEAIDVAIAGDDAPIPMLERKWASAAAEARDPSAFLSSFARALRDSAVRSAGLIAAAHEAAPSDPEIAELTGQLSEQRVTTVTWIVDCVRSRAPLRPGLTRKRAIDTMWLLMDPTVFVRLTRDRGWTPRQFEAWFTDSATRLLLDLDGEPRTRAHRSKGQS